MSKTFFDHFDCRTLSDDLSVLTVDNSVTCQDGMWILFAGISGIGLLVVSFGVPLFLLYIMHRAMQEKLQEIRGGIRELWSRSMSSEQNLTMWYVALHTPINSVPSITSFTSIMKNACLGRQL